LKSGAAVGTGRILFPRIQPGKDEGPMKNESAAPLTIVPTEAPKIGYPDFEKVQLKTAKVLEAARVEGADKLLCLQIEMGGERRQIVAGIAAHYRPEDLVGRSIVVVANLKPAKIRGVESNGMLLAASSGDVLRLVTVDGDIPSGSRVK
jgi:methionyl-tRNA synthetase